MSQFVQCGRRIKGFSLVELLTVMGVITIMAALVFPAFGTAKDQAKHRVCASNLHQLGEGIYLYSSDHDSWVPPFTNDEGYLQKYEPDRGSRGATQSIQPFLITSSMQIYIKNEEVWYCPSDKYRKRNVYHLGIAHLQTSYKFLFADTKSMGEQVWPVRLNIDSATDANQALAIDALGIPARDSSPTLGDTSLFARSNHIDNWANYLRISMSLGRVNAQDALEKDGSLGPIRP